MSAGVAILQADFCVELQQLAIRRRDPLLLYAAIWLRAEHASNEAERMAFAQSSTPRRAPQQAPGSSMRIEIRGGDR